MLNMSLSKYMKSCVIIMAHDTGLNRARTSQTANVFMHRLQNQSLARIIKSNVLCSDLSSECSESKYSEFCYCLNLILNKV